MNVEDNFQVVHTEYVHHILKSKNRSTEITYYLYITLIFFKKLNISTVFLEDKITHCANAKAIQFTTVDKFEIHLANDLSQRQLIHEFNLDTNRHGSRLLSLISIRV